MDAMKDHARENLTELLRRFMDEPAVRAVREDVEAADRILDAHPAPVPSPETLAAIKTRMVATALRRRRRTRIFRSAVAAAAAILVTVLVEHHGRVPAGSSGISLASIIPTAVWESHDIANDDLDLVYFTSEIRQIEAQMQALEAGETEIRGNNAVDDLETELIAIETEFWKG